MLLLMLLLLLSEINFSSTCKSSKTKAAALRATLLWHGETPDWFSRN
ncbi:MAG: hypothetical protein R3D29_06840 [Nitratireductor sp.]